MEKFVSLAQLCLAVSVAFVWIFRFENVVKEFKQFGLSDLIRNAVGVSKIALSTLLVAGIWFSPLVYISSILMGLFMIAAQYNHFRIKNSLIKHLPSLILLILCVIIAIGSHQ